MRRFLLLSCLLAVLSLSSCQCSEKPDTGPIEGEDAAVMVAPAPRA